MGTKNNTAAKLGVIGLASIVISSMVGGGVFSLPQNMAAGASAGAVLLAWVITGIGMYFIANTFSVLSRVKPDLTAGIYMYAREGFGPYMGFTIGWGYWLCQIFGNVGYAVITMDALNYFFPPYFAGGNNLLSIVCGSLLIWVFNFVVLRGVRQAAVLNVIGTIGKLVPLLLFCLILLFCFHLDKFDFNFWGKMAESGKTLGSLPAQLKSTMLVTLWAFIGIEGAVVLSSRAKSQSAVSKATFLGFLGCLVIYIGLSVLPFGFLTQEEIASVANPSTAGVLEKVVGPWGAWMMNIGLLVAVLSSWLAWTMIAAEIPAAAAENGTFPKQFAVQNKNGSPSVSLWVTSFLMQLAIFLVYFSNNAWNTMLSITGVMVLPAYLASTAYLWKLTEDGEYAKISPKGRAAALITSTLGTVYALWLVYAAGLKYLFLAVIFLALGIPVFIWARKQKKDGNPVFTRGEVAVVTLLVIAAVAAVYVFSRGLVSI
ncbi:MAG: amino acid permease [Candidatus Avelusimicrobium sp.]|uniref:amino acid permease n=1 Tax=Candidatus Avelusimicrobium sp. TaxID=3048833 RepID=UPI003F12906B